MAQNFKVSSQQWERYLFMRDNGHEQFVRRADKCSRYYNGDQWSVADTQRLKEAGRPYLTINEIRPTVNTLVGEQIHNRMEASFRPKYGKGTADVAAALSKVYKHILTTNQAQWLRADVFEDGVICGRGYYDIRLDFSDSLSGEVRIERVNPKNVMLAPDCTDYDPDSWPDVIVTKWMTPADIEVMYGKAKADQLRTRQMSSFFYGYDSLDAYRDRAGSTAWPGYGTNSTQGYTDQDAYVRVIDRQYRVVARRKFFADMRLGDTRPVPDEWDKARIDAYLEQNPGVGIIERVGTRIRWTVTADDIVLHDDWSPYEHFTVVPYFPYFRNGETGSPVTDLLDIQDLLNKSTSQELHVVNTTANSGWRVKTGSLRNMTINELEVRGAQTGLVMELDEVDDAQKIQPNQIPNGLDRLSQRAESFVGRVSGVNDYMHGGVREDVSGRASERNTERGLVTMGRVLDNLSRTDHFIARAVLCLVQTFYTEERMLNITTDELLGEQETLKVNEVTPEGTIANDLTVGEYDVVIVTKPAREMLEDSEFEHAAELRELGIPISDERMVMASRLLDKADIIREMRKSAETPEAQQARQLAMAKEQAEVDNLHADTERTRADAANKQAQAEHKATQAQKTVYDAASDATRRSPDERRVDIEERRVNADIELRRRQLEQDYELAMQELEFEREELRVNAATQRAAAAQAKRTPTNKEKS